MTRGRKSAPPTPFTDAVADLKREDESAPAPHSGPLTSRAAREALLRLGVNPADVLALPRVTPLLQRLSGGIPHAIEILRFSDQADARRFLDCYDSLSKRLANALPIEAFCLAAGVPPKRIWGLIAEEAIETSGVHAAIIAATHLPAVVEKSIEVAKTTDGIDDRKLQMQHAKFIPMPKGSTTSITVQQVAQASSLAAQQQTPALPPADEFVRNLHDQFNKTSIPALPEAEIVTVPEFPAAEEQIVAVERAAGREAKVQVQEFSAEEPSVQVVRDETDEEEV